MMGQLPKNQRPLAACFVCLLVTFFSLFRALDDSPRTIVVTISSDGFPVDWSLPSNTQPLPAPLDPPHTTCDPEAYLPQCKHKIVNGVYPWAHPVTNGIKKKLQGSASAPHRRLSVASLLTCAVAVSSADPLSNIAANLCQCVEQFRSHHSFTSPGISKWLNHRAQCRLPNILLLGAGCLCRPLCQIVVQSEDPLKGDPTLKMENFINSRSKVPMDASFIAQKEGLTYHTLWRAVRVVSDHCLERSCRGPSSPGNLIPGWTRIQVFEELPYGSPSVNARPCGHVAVSGNTMMLALRGSSQTFDWIANLQYGQVGMSGSLKWAGKVHRGLSKFVEALIPPFLNLLSKPEHSHISRVVIAGHSLGGGVATLLGYQVAVLTDKSVDVVGFASPKVGNKEFVEALSRTVNHRNIVFNLDVISSIPCRYMPVCTSWNAIVPTGPTDNDGSMPPSEWIYDESPGLVKFDLQDMPDTSLWKNRRRVQLQIAANHMCAYTCWLSHNFSPTETFTECNYSQDSLPSTCQYAKVTSVASLAKRFWKGKGQKPSG